MEKGDDPYEILGVGYDASEDEIKKTYRKLALKYHPDRQSTDEDKEKAHDVFAKISAAYDTLTDPVKRYDWKQANESKLNGTAKNAAPGGPPKRQNTAPSTGSTRKNPPAAAPRPRSVSPKAKAPRKSTTAAATGAPPPPTGPFAFRPGKPKGNPHSQHPMHKQSQKSTSSGDSVTSRRSTASAPPMSYSQTPHTKETTGRSTVRPQKSTNVEANDTSYSTTPGIREELASPKSLKKKASLILPTSYSATPGTREEFVPPKALKKNVSKATSKKNDSSNLKEAAPKNVPATKKSTVSSHRSLSTSDHGLKPIPNHDDREKHQSLKMNGSGGLRRPRSMVVPTTKRSSSHSPRPGSRKSVNDILTSKSPGVVRGGKKGDDIGVSTKTTAHDPLEAFERILKREFAEDYWEQDFKKKGFFGGSKKVVTAKSKFNVNNPSTVVSMTTCTKKEKRSDNPKLIDLKTVTKVLRLDGSVEKIIQASVLDKEEAKKIETDTITITREKAIKQAQK